MFGWQIAISDGVAVWLMTSEKQTTKTQGPGVGGVTSGKLSCDGKHFGGFCKDWNEILGGRSEFRSYQWEVMGMRGFSRFGFHFTLLMRTSKMNVQCGKGSFLRFLFSQKV